MKFNISALRKYDRKKIRNIKDKAIRKILLGFGLTAVIFIILILVFLMVEGLPFFFKGDGVDFFTGDVWDPSSPNTPRYGILPMVLGTFLVTLGAIVIAIPIILKKLNIVFRFSRKLGKVAALLYRFHPAGKALHHRLGLVQAVDRRGEIFDFLAIA